MLVALLLIALAVIEAIGLYGAYGDLRAGADGVRSARSALGTAPATWTPDAVAAAQSRLATANAELARGRARVDADPVLGLALHVPVAGDQAAAVRDLADAAANAGVAAGDVARVAALYADTSAASGPPGGRVIQVLQQAAPLLQDAKQRLQGSLDRIDADRAHPLLPQLRHQLELAAVELAAADQDVAAAAGLAVALPAALGGTAPKTYLVLLANPTELRPDGGFSGVVGTLTLDGGNPTAVHLVDQYTLNPLYAQKFPIPPPLAAHMRFYDNSLELGDEGWDPDFPTTAKLAASMWQSAKRQPVDGVLEIDPYAIAALLAVTGPVSVPGIGTFDSQNLLPQLNILVNAQGEAKATTVPPVAEAVIRAILSTPGSNWSRLATILLDQARQRHLQLYVNDARLERVLTDAGLDGALPAPGVDDFLMVVDGNVGATKADAYVQKKLEVKVEKPASGLTRHQVAATYSFPALQSATDQKLNPKTTNNPAGAYRDYVRFFVPQASTLTGFQVLVDGRPTFTNSVAENGIDHDRRVIGGFFELPPGHTASVTLTYDTPLDPVPAYVLDMQKQAGRPSLPTTLEVSYPGGIANRTAELALDTTLEVRW